MIVAEFTGNGSGRSTLEPAQDPASATKAEDYTHPDGDGGHRRHHLVHQHLQPERDAGVPAWSRARPVAKGLTRKPWVKTSLAPGSRWSPTTYEAAGLQEDLEALGFNLVGYGCTTCIGNSGPLPEP